MSLCTPVGTYGLRYCYVHLTTVRIVLPFAIFNIIQLMSHIQMGAEILLVYKMRRLIIRTFLRKYWRMNLLALRSWFSEAVDVKQLLSVFYR